MDITPNAKPLTDTSVIVQASHAPVFRGSSSKLFRCNSCGHVLIEGYDSRRLIAIRIECFRCKTITMTDPWPVGEPLPNSLLNLGRAGRIALSDPVDVREGVALSSSSEIERVKGLTGPRAPSRSRWELSRSWLNALETELDILTDGAVQKMAARVRRADRAGNAKYGHIEAPPVWAMARLRSALEAGYVDFGGSDGLAFAYVQTLRDCLDRWHDRPRFSEIARSLCYDFHHAVTTLSIASYLSDHGNHIGITHTSAQQGRSPDLFINVDGYDKLSMEVKCPRALFLPSERLTAADLARKLEKEIKSAAGQITGSGGIVVIGSGRPSDEPDLELTQAIDHIIARGKISRQVAAVSSIQLYSRVPRNQHANERGWTIGGWVHVALNPRFIGPNPVETQHKPDWWAGREVNWL